MEQLALKVESAQTINEKLSEGWLVKFIVSQVVSASSNFSREGGFMVIFEREINKTSPL